MLHRLLFEYGEAMRILHEQFVKSGKMTLHTFLGFFFDDRYIRDGLRLLVERLERMLTYADVC